MIRFAYFAVVTGVAMCATVSLAVSQEKTFTFEEIDKNKTLAEAFAAKKDPCPIVFMNGKPYFGCPNFKFDELDNAIAKFESK